MNTRPCKGCGQPIAWVVTRNGKRMPIDPEYDNGGNVWIEPGEPPRVVHVGQRPLFDEWPLNTHGPFMPHHATCPNVDDFR